MMAFTTRKKRAHIRGPEATTVSDYEWGKAGKPTPEEWKRRQKAAFMAREEARKVVADVSSE